MKHNRQYTGALAQARGENFERMFEYAGRRAGITVERIPDSCKVIGKNNLVRIKSPFDFVLAYQGRTAAIDAKATSASNFTYGMVDPHQTHHLSNFSIQQIPAGYVVYFRDDKHRVVFFEVAQLIALKPQTSLRPEQGLLLGTIDNFSLMGIWTLTKDGKCQAIATDVQNQHAKENSPLPALMK